MNKKIILFFLLFISFFLLAKKVLAQGYCYGLYTCCTTDANYTCPDPRGLNCQDQPGSCYHYQLYTCSVGGTVCPNYLAPCGPSGQGTCNGVVNYNIQCVSNPITKCITSNGCSTLGAAGAAGCNASQIYCTGNPPSNAAQCHWVQSCTPGTWSACSVACGGGTQTMTDSCGNPFTQPCNTQSCGTGGGCIPSCNPACGQGDGCGNTCPNNASGAPGLATSLIPANGGAASPVANKITVSWSAAPKATKYNVEVYPQGTAAGKECTAPNTHCSLGQTATSYTFTITGGVQNYTWRVQAINTNCGNFTGGWAGPQNFTVGGDFTGGFHTDTNGAATINGGTGLCQLAGAVAKSPGSGTVVSAQWTGGTNTDTLTGVVTTFTLNNVGFDPNTIVSAAITDPTLRCTCPTDCSYSGLSVTKANVNFYLTNASGGWWQTANGLLYAGATSVNALVSQIPNSCVTPTCTPALSLRDTADTVNSEGYAMTAGGSIDSTGNSGTQYTDLRQDGSTAHSTGLILNGPKENYEYFTQLYSMGTSPASDNLTGNAKPAAAPLNGRAYYQNGDLNINNAWALANTDNMVIFVNGNLNINHDITVPNGGFLAFIVKGNIVMSNTVGVAAVATTTPAQVEGVFITDGSIQIPGGSPGAFGDLKFIGDGSFVAWGGFSFGRSYKVLSNNNTHPIELFHFRPDFVENMPNRMKKPILIWQETNG